MTLRELRDQRATVHKQAVALLAKPQTAETRTQLDRMFGDIDSLGNEIERIQAAGRGAPAPRYRSLYSDPKEARRMELFSKFLRGSITQAEMAEQRAEVEGDLLAHIGTYTGLGFFVPTGFVNEVEVATKYGEHSVVINCIAAHHDDVPHDSAISVIVQAADAISGARPGARREALETYVKRLTAIEQIAAEFGGVEKVYAIQAGREVRVIVAPGTVDDTAATGLADQISRRIERELQYPGQIRVVVIRETRAVDIAR